MDVVVPNADAFLFHSILFFVTQTVLLVQGGYYDQATDPPPPELSCPDQTTFDEKGNLVRGPIKNAPFPTTDLNHSPIDPSIPDQDPYQSISIVFRQLANQLIDGMCSDCEDCIETATTKYSKTVKDPKTFCSKNGLCPKEAKRSKSTKSTKGPKSIKAAALLI